MKAQSNIPLPNSIQRWKDGQFIYYFNHKDNGIQEKEKEGQRYEADFTISNGETKADIETALIRSIADPVLEKCVIDNIEIEGLNAIEIIKPYKKTQSITNQLNTIFISSPVEIKPIEEIKEDEIIRLK